MSAGRIVLIVFGAIFLLISIGMLIAGGALVWVNQDLTDSEGFITTDTITLDRNSYAITTHPADVDFKGWWRSRGVRCEPLTVRDEHSRYILEVRAMENARTETVRRSFERLFERHGLPMAIRSDNGSPFASGQGLLGLSRLSVWWVALGIDLERGRPGRPQDNGAHERMHKDISRELEAIGESDQEALDVWRQTFNYERPHESLGMKRPAEVYRSSERKYEGTPEDLEYPQMCSRRVSPSGVISLDGQNIFLSNALAGWSVGLKPMAPDLLEVWLGRLPLGQIDPSTSSFVPADFAPKQTAAPPSSCG